MKKGLIAKLKFLLSRIVRKRNLKKHRVTETKASEEKEDARSCDRKQIIADFLKYVKTGTIKETDEDICTLVRDCRDALVAEGMELGRERVMNDFKQSSSYRQYASSIELAIPANLSAIVDKLMEIVRSEAQQNNESELLRQIDDLNSQVLTLRQQVQEYKEAKSEDADIEVFKAKMKELESSLQTETEGRVSDKKEHCSAMERLEKELTEAKEQELQKVIKEEREQAEIAINKLNEENQERIKDLKKKMKKQLDNVTGERQKIFDDRKNERQMLAYEMQQHIARIYQQLNIAFKNSIGNYKAEGAELIRQAELMYNWFQSDVVAPFQAKDSLPQSEILEIVKQQSIIQIQDRYSLVSRLTRITSYSHISTVWVEWMSKQGVDVNALRMAYSEMLALMGRCKINLVVPTLFSDIYSKKEAYTLNLTFSPIVNLCPPEFDHLKNGDVAIVRDLSHPGFAIEGHIQVNPEILAQ